MSLLLMLVGRKYGEIKIILAVLSVLIILPIVSMVILVSAPTAAIGSALASLNPSTKEISIFDPRGQIVTQVKVSTIWPSRGYVSDEFGTFDSIRESLGLSRHSGIDIANSYGVSGEIVTAFMAGTVTKVDTRGLGSCGKYIIVRHEFNISSQYCHLHKVNVVTGQAVTQGQSIGLMGNTGASTGPHLHFMITVYDIPINPRTFLSGGPLESTVKNGSRF